MPITNFCILSQAADVSFANGTRTNLAWDTIERNPAGMYNPLFPERITIKEQGLYEVKVNLVSSASPSSGDVEWVTIYRQVGTTPIPIATNAEVPFGGFYATVGVTRLIDLNADEYLFVLFGNSSGVSQTLYGGPSLDAADSSFAAPFFSAVKLSD